MKLLLKITWVRLLREIEANYKELKTLIKNMIYFGAIILLMCMCVYTGYYLRGVEKEYEDEIAVKQRQIDSLNSVINLNPLR